MACAECFRGFERIDTKATGRETTLYGLPTYVAQPGGGGGGGGGGQGEPAAKGIIVIISDIFGWQFVNNRLLADAYAAAGYRVYLPDFLAGRAAPLWVLESVERVVAPAASWPAAVRTKPAALFWAVVGGLSALWLNWPSASFPRVQRWFERLRADEAAAGLKVGAAGFCWGGKHTLTLTEQAHAHLVDAAFTAHPSFLTLPGDVERVRRPLSIALGSRDNMVSVQQARDAEQTLLKLGQQFPDQLAGKSEVRIYEGAGHGFSVRIDRANAKQVQQAHEAEAQALAWFDRFLAQ